MARQKQTVYKAVGAKAPRMRPIVVTAHGLLPTLGGVQGCSSEAALARKKFLGPHAGAPAAELLIRRGAFRRLVKALVSEQSAAPSDLLISSDALGALQEAAESYIVGLFEDAHFSASASRQLKVRSKDMALAQRIRGGRAPSL